MSDPEKVICITKYEQNMNTASLQFVTKISAI